MPPAGLDGGGEQQADARRASSRMADKPRLTFSNSGVPVYMPPAGLDLGRLGRNKILTAPLATAAAEQQSASSAGSAHAASAACSNRLPPGAEYEHDPELDALLDGESA